jgi:CubicO group peptidase (beta-lactamase class C family)
MSRTAFSRFLTAVAALLLAVAGVAPGDAGAQVGPDARARIDSVFADVDRSGSPGCAVGVTVRGRLEVAKGYGLATLDYRRPLTPTSVFPIASMSKQFTAAAAVIAARRGLFSLDDPVRRWVPDLPEYDAGPITLRHLVHHTSGLRDNYNLGYLAGWDNLDAHDTEEYLELVYRQQGLNFAPGTDNAYSNTNYLLLAEAVAEASGTSYRQFVHDVIFAPLGVDNTTLPTTEPGSSAAGRSATGRPGRASP